MRLENKKQNKKYIILSILFSFILLLIITLICFSVYFMKPVRGSKKVEFIINEGESTREIAKSLKKEGLIKNEKFFLAYIYITNNRNIYAAKYDLNSNMKLSEIVKILKEGGKNINEITLTFKEGANIREIAKIISKETNNKYNDVLSLANDKTYISELIKKYWFINEDILNKEIYYSLEGYLFPDSYNFASKDVTIKEIFNDMLDNTNKKLTNYQKSFNSNKYSVHELLTVASMLELEAAGKNSRKDIAGIFYNRLNANMSLGSDASSYYGVKKDLTTELTVSEFNQLNSYNTRAIGMEGKLPVGPICNPSLLSIEAALEPTKHDYYYFVTDKNGKVYLTKDLQAHEKVIKDLKNKGLWFEW